jgi:hypothetical protein
LIKVDIKGSGGCGGVVGGSALIPFVMLFVEGEGKRGYVGARFLFFIFLIFFVSLAALK